MTKRLAALALPSQKELKEMLQYDSETGLFVWKQGQRTGSFAGATLPEGYLTIRINKKRFLLHRLAWIYVHGDVEVEFIDHVNGIRSDNRICNLRMASLEVNAQNRSTYAGKAVKGCYVNKYGRWTARIRIQNGKQITIGKFDTEEEATAAYWKVKMEIHPGAISPLSLIGQTP